MAKNLEFKLNGKPFIELKNLLKVMGLFESGGMAKVAIDEGKVLVDGTVETRKACKIKASSVVVCEGSEIKVL